ncbi:MAG TPA: NACHT and WD repeat domain-containing protein [Pyrinomonadaceae bacterium]|nr:NACHT and WD repeat domain-containing protein [Pyrinomonadaceae bacterium]
MSSPPPDDNELFRFPSLASLKAVNNQMLKRRRMEENSTEFLNEVVTFVKKGQATGAVLNVDSERWTAQSLLDYWANFLDRRGERVPAAEVNLALFDSRFVQEIGDDKQPYLGLSPFRENSKKLFFGREKLVEELATTLKRTRLLAIVGPSGSGKSSLVLAGLLPELKNGKIAGSEKWHYFPPIVPGFEPLTSLISLVHPLESASGKANRVEAEKLKAEPGKLLELINQLTTERAVIIVDQFEEIFTLTTDEATRSAFITNLLSLIEYPDLRHTVILTMRSDFKPYVAKIAELQTYFDRGAVPVTDLSPAELHDVIQNPADLIGLKFEEGLVDQLVLEALAEPAGLPLLQFTLLKLWNARVQNLVTWEAFHHLGSCREALTRSADEFYMSLSPFDQTRAKWILLRLVRPGGGVEVFSNRVARDTLYESVQEREHIDRVLNGLIKAGLVRETPGSVEGEVKVEVAHEVLVRQWRKLVGWLEEARVHLRKRLVLTEAAQQWDASGQDPSALLRGSVLDEALRYDDLNQQEQAFVQKSLSQKRFYKRLFILTVSATIVVLAFLTIYSLWSAHLAKNNAEVAKSAARQALSGQLAAEARDSKTPLDLGLLLSLEANQLEPTAEARNSLLVLLAQNPRLVAYLHGAKRQALALCYPNNSTLISVNEGGTISIWDPQNPAQARKEIRILNQRPEKATISPDGKTVAFIAEGGQIGILDVATGQQRWNFSYPASDDLVFSHDGKTLAIKINPSEPSSVVLRDVLTGEVQRSITLGNATDYLSAVAFSPDGKLIATASGSHFVARPDKRTEISLQDIKTGRTVRRLKVGLGDDFPNSPLAFSPDGNIVASTISRSIILWDQRKNRHVQIADENAENIHSLVFSRDGKYLVSDGDGGTLHVWSIEAALDDDDPAYVSLVGPASSSLQIAVSEKGVASSGPSGDVVLWDLVERKGKLENYVPLAGSDSRFSVAALSSDGRTMAAGERNGETVLFDVVTGAEMVKVPLPTVIAEAAPEKNESTASQARMTSRISQSGRSVEAQGREVAGLFLNRDATVLAIEYGERSTALLWDATANQLIHQIPTDPANALESLCLSADGKAFAWSTRKAGPVAAGRESNEESSLFLWRFSSDPQPTLISKGKNISSSIAFSPDGQLLAVGDDKASIGLWNTLTGKQIATLADTSKTSDVDENSRLEIRSLAFSPSGQILAAGTSDRRIFLWNVAEGRQLDEPLIKHTLPVTKLIFNADGAVLASGDNEGKIILWDVARRQPSGTIPTEIFEAFDLAFTPDGKSLAVARSAMWDEVGASPLSLWDIDVTSWFREACSMANRNLTKSEWRQYMGSERPYHPTCPNVAAVTQ